MSRLPYNWQSHSPAIEISREAVDRVAGLMCNNGSAVVMGGRGMGKSVFLRQLKTRLEVEGGVEVVLVETPPATLTVEACLGLLARRLGVSADPFNSRPIFDEYFSRTEAPKKLVLLFDEFDRYAEKGRSVQPPGREFFNDLEASRRSLPRLAILAAGSIGIFVVRDVLGSSFLARALYVPLRPFRREHVETLASPFAERAASSPSGDQGGATLSEDVLDTLLLASGGIPALVTYGLQGLWALERPSLLDDVTSVYKTFQRDYREYLRDLLSALKDPRLSDAPSRVWEHIRKKPGRLSRAELKTALGSASGALKLSLDDALYLLEVTGAVRIESSEAHDDPIIARPIASLLDLVRESEPEGDLRTRFLDDLAWLLARLHRSSVDFFRPATSKTGGDRPRLVPESVFTAHLALGFELLGWRAEREAQRGAGRTDLILRRNGDDEVVILELKIWGRNDFREAHSQVESYWAHDVAFGAVIQLTDAALPDWAEDYRRECLEPRPVAVTARSVADDSPVSAHFSCVSSTADGREAHVDHVLLRLPRRKRFRKR